MALVKHVHRDLLGRVIKHSDIVVWGNGKSGQTTQIARVVGTTAQQVQIYVLSNKKTTKAYPSRLIVITQQVAANLAGNVGTPKAKEQDNAENSEA